jgi:hypothetical protein
MRSSLSRPLKPELKAMIIRTTIREVRRAVWHLLFTLGDESRLRQKQSEMIQAIQMPGGSNRKFSRNTAASHSWRQDEEAMFTSEASSRSQQSSVVASLVPLLARPHTSGTGIRSFCHGANRSEDVLGLNSILGRWSVEGSPRFHRRKLRGGLGWRGECSSRHLPPRGPGISAGSGSGRLSRIAGCSCVRSIRLGCLVRESVEAGFRGS